MLSALSKQQLQLLTIYALYNTEGSQANSILPILNSLPTGPCTDLKHLTKTLCTQGLIDEYAFNWRTDSYDHCVKPELLIKVMQYLVEKEPEGTIEVLNAVGAELQPTVIQKMLWEFISSSYQHVNIEKIDDYAISKNLTTLIPAVLDYRFAPLLLLFNKANFFGLIEETLRYLFSTGELTDIYNLSNLIKGYQNIEITQQKESIQCTLDLYRYLAYGKTPDYLLSSNRDHRIIAGIYEALHGNDKKGLDHFKKALSLNNKDKGYATSKPYLPWEIANFYFVTIAKRTFSDDGRKKALGISKVQEENLTRAAKILYSILYSTNTEKQQKKELMTLLTSKKGIDRIMAKMMFQYIGMTNAETQITEFSDIHIHWNILNENALLMNMPHREDYEDDNTSPTRKAYFMTSTRVRTVETRMQSMLKSGQWGAGKRLSGQNKMIEDVLIEVLEGTPLYGGRYAPHYTIEVNEEMPYMRVTRTPNGFTVDSNVPREAIEQGIFISHRGKTSINFIRIGERQRKYYDRLIEKIFPLSMEEKLKHFLVKASMQRFSDGSRLEIHSDLLEGGSTLPIRDADTKLVIQILKQEKQRFAIEIFIRTMEGGKMQLTPGRGKQVIIDGMGENRTRINRDMELEFKIFNDFIEATALNGETSMILGIYDLLPLLEYAQQHQDTVICEWPEGTSINIKTKSTKSIWNGNIKRNENGWFDIEGSINVDQEKVLSMAQLLELSAQSHGKYIRLNDGEFLALSEKLRQQLNRLASITSRHHSRLQMSPFSAALLSNNILEGELRLEGDKELQKIRQRIKKASEYHPRVPATLQATLRTYQKEGYQWMMRLNKWGAGALLADDMGLGKTIQTIALLLAKAKEGPALVIAPASVAPNWNTEFARFAPSLNIIMLNYETSRSEAIRNAGEGDVVVMSYMLLLSVKEDVINKRWKTICLDEAHIIKNRGAKTSAIAMKLKSDYRIMLTGTPVQNHLGELWNLFQFVNPGLLGSFENFNKRFIQPIELLHDKVAQENLDNLIKPFMLRRTKDKVAQELPDKEEIYQHVTLSEEEIVRYEAMRQKTQTIIEEELKNNSGNQNISFNTLAEITKLRLCACSKSKIVALTELLMTIMEGGGSSLVFSQFTTYLTQIKRNLDEAHIHYIYIDGSTPIKERQQLVERFQNGECPVFLISLKAGGLGLNLTHANYVIHMDPWWNPAIEAQATDRAHRIGQKQAVTVYHLISEGTIEEKIQRLHARKKELADNVLKATDMSYRLTGEELLEMVRGSGEAISAP